MKLVRKMLLGHSVLCIHSPSRRALATPEMSLDRTSESQSGLLEVAAAAEVRHLLSVGLCKVGPKQVSISS